VPRAPSSTLFPYTPLFRSVKPDQIRITCNLFVDHLARQREIERFWLETAGVPASSLCRSTVNTYSRHSKRKRLNMLPYGTCRVRSEEHTSELQSQSNLVCR